MLADLDDLLGGLALSLPALADAVLGAMLAMYAGGMPDGVGPDGLAAGTAAAAAAAGAAAYGPHLPAVSAQDRAMGRHRYRDSAGNPYWPGISPIPADGIVYPPASDEDRARAGDRSNSPERGGGFSPNPLPVGPKGMPIYPPLDPDLEAFTADRPPSPGSSAGARG